MKKITLRICCLILVVLTVLTSLLALSSCSESTGSSGGGGGGFYGNSGSDKQPETEKDYEIFYEPTPEENIQKNEDGIAYVDNEVLVVAKEGTAKTDVEALAAKYDAVVIGYIEITDDYQWRFNSVQSYDQLLEIVEKLKQEEIIVSADINHLSIVSDSTIDNSNKQTIPNDSQWSSLWDVSHPNGGNWGAEAIRAPFAWSYKDEMNPVRVGLMDSMFDTNHDDLAFAETFYNVSNLTSDHGSHVAGTMAATFDNNEGIAGIFPYGRDKNGDPNIYGYSYSGTIYSGLFQQKVGLAELITRDVKVINISYGFVVDGFAASRDEPGFRKRLTDNAKVLSDFLEKFIDKGHDFVIVQAAGNDRGYRFKLRSSGEWVNVDHAIQNHYDIPEDYQGFILGNTQDNIADWGFYYSVISNEKVKSRIIVVGASDHKYDADNNVYYELASFSSTGSRVDIIAPGVNIESCVASSTEYGLESGTSMAAPHVAGVCASVWSYNNELTGPSIKNIVKGAGIIDVRNTTVNMVDMYSALKGSGGKKDNGDPTDKDAYIYGYARADDVYTQGITVQLVDENDNVKETTTTNEDGLFELVAGAGTYRLKLSYDGYADTYSEVIVAEDTDIIAVGTIDLLPLVNDFTIPEEMVVTIGEINVIEPVIDPPEATSYTIKWTSSDDSILSVSPTGEAGIITGRAKGTVTVTAELTSGDRVITKTTSVRVASKARDTVLVLDISGSMEGTPLQEMKESAINFCNELLKDEYNNRVGLVFYDDEVESINLTGDLDYLVSVISSVDDGGRTNMEGGLSAADYMLANFGREDSVKNVLIMADGLPNEGRTSESGSMPAVGYSGYNTSVEYANAVIDTARAMMSRYNLYSLGYFHDLSEENKNFAVTLMRELTNQTDGYYQVDRAEDLQFVFGDVTEDIGTGAKIVVNIACPVDVYVKYGEETLSSAESDYNDIASFGTLKLLGKDRDIKVVSLDSDKQYDIEIVGTGDGKMDYSVNYFDENEVMTDYRSFESVPITTETFITSDTDNSEEVTLNVDDDGDGEVDTIWSASENGEGSITYQDDPPEPEVPQEPEKPSVSFGGGGAAGSSDSDTDPIVIIVIVSIAVMMTMVAVVILIIVLVRKNNDDDSSDKNSNYGTPEQIKRNKTTEEQEKSSGVIHIISGSMNGVSIPVAKNETLRLGKDPKTSHLVFSGDYRHVSRMHCTVTYNAAENMYYVVDFSSNGTYYANKARLTKGLKTPVKPGTALLLGNGDCTILLG